METLSSSEIKHSLEHFIIKYGHGRILLLSFRKNLIIIEAFDKFTAKMSCEYMELLSITWAEINQTKKMANLINVIITYQTIIMTYLIMSYL